MQDTFLRAAERYVDFDYAEKVWKQGQELHGSDREEFTRKVELLIRWPNEPLFHEISGLVNDRGAMQKVLTTEEIKRRHDFILEESGQLDH